MEQYKLAILERVIQEAIKSLNDLAYSYAGDAGYMARVIAANLEKALNEPGEIESLRDTKARQ